MYTFSEGKFLNVAVVVSYDDNYCTVIFEGKTKFVTFERANYDEIERFNSNREPPVDEFYRHYLYDGDDEMIGVKKTLKEEYEVQVEDELDLIKLELVDK